MACQRNRVSLRKNYSILIDVSVSQFYFIGWPCLRPSFIPILPISIDPDFTLISLPSSHPLSSTSTQHKCSNNLVDMSQGKYWLEKLTPHYGFIVWREEEPNGRWKEWQGTEASHLSESWKEHLNGEFLCTVLCLVQMLSEPKFQIYYLVA